MALRLFLVGVVASLALDLPNGGLSPSRHPIHSVREWPEPRIASIEPEVISPPLEVAEADPAPSVFVDDEPGAPAPTTAPPVVATTTPTAPPTDPIAPAVADVPKPEASKAPIAADAPKPEAPAVADAPKPEAPAAPVVVEIKTPEAPAAPVVVDAPKPEAPAAPVAVDTPKPEAPAGLTPMPAPIPSPEIAALPTPSPSADAAPAPVPTVVTSEPMPAAAADVPAPVIAEEIKPAVDPDAAFVSIVRKMASTFAADLPAPPVEPKSLLAKQEAPIPTAPESAPPPPPVDEVADAADDEWFPGLASALNRPAEGLTPVPIEANSRAEPAPASAIAEPSIAPSRAERLANAVKLTGQAVNAWAMLLSQRPTVSALQR